MRLNPFLRKLLVILAVPLLLAALFPFQHKLAGKWQNEFSKEIIYLPPAALFENIRFGYEGLLSDILWIRGFHYIEGQLDLPPGGRYKQLYPLYDCITTLDPYFLGAYHFGFLLLWALAHEPENAAALIKKGIKNLPDEWMLYYDIAALYFIYFKDRETAEKYVDQGLKLSYVPPGLIMLATAIKMNAGGRRAALQVWMGYLDDKNEQVRKIAREKVLRLTRQIALEDLNKAIEQYKKQKGVPPKDLNDLVKAGIIERIPEDAAEGKGKYVLDPKTGRAKLEIPPDGIPLYKPRPKE